MSPGSSTQISLQDPGDWTLAMEKCPWKEKVYGARSTAPTLHGPHSLRLEEEQSS